jgi:thiamine-phosphate pyrophosphorylase
VSAAAGLPAALRLIVVLDADAAGDRDLAALAGAAARGGATMLQLRAKPFAGSTLAEAARRVIAAAGGIPVIVNDRLDVALATGAAGCHLGQDDFPIADARQIAPAGFMLGGSAGDADEARRATRAGAHYLGVGPVRATTGKPDAGAAIGASGFARVREATTLPCVAIGGVTAADVPGLLAAGAAGIAVIGAVLGAADPEKATRALREALQAAEG